jgi:hypothetical protein
MPNPSQPVKYSIAVADELSGALTQLRAKIEWYLGYREHLAKKMLDCPDTPPTSISWQGARRKRFDSEFGDQRRELLRLAAEASALTKLVDQATAQAREANK